MAEQVTPKVGQLITEDGFERDCVHIAVVPVIADSDYVGGPGDVVALVPGSTARVTHAYKDDADVVGIIDPFLRDSPNKGDKFYLFLLPSTITGLKHRWSHPAFDAPAGVGVVALISGVDYSTIQAERAQEAAANLSTEAALKAAVQANPHDEGARAAHVDWLLEHHKYEEAAYYENWKEAVKWLEDFATTHGVTYDTVVQAAKTCLVDGTSYVQYGSESLRNFMTEDASSTTFWNNFELATLTEVATAKRRYQVFSCSC